MYISQQFPPLSVKDVTDYRCLNLLFNKDADAEESKKVLRHKFIGSIF